VEARGILSGILQQAYAFGYLLATAFNQALVPTTSQSWRSLYWFSAALPIPVIIWRLFWPETETFGKIMQVRHDNPETNSAFKLFFAEIRVAIRDYWLMFLYLILLMAGANFASHGSQDLYPTLLTNSLGFSSSKATVTNVVANLGALTGGTICGYMSDYLGRRLTIILACIGGGALIYPWVFISNNGVMAGAFFEQFFVQGLWGVIPIHLTELSPESLRSFTVGTSYQLGNLASSASSTIESRIGERFPIPGTTFYDYSKVMAIFMGCVYAYLIIVVFFGPERKGRSMYVGESADAHEKKYKYSSDNGKESSAEERV